MSAPQVTVRLINKGCLLAKADVAGATMTIIGFSVMLGKNSGPAWVADPATKVGETWVKTIEFHDDNTRKAVHAAILAEYDKAVKAAATAPKSAPPTSDAPLGF
jgi:DNA-binding cell septation regulator SpoVG